MVGFKLDKVLLAMLVVYGILLSTTLNNPHHVDESTHSFVGMFFRDFASDFMRSPTLSFSKIYDYTTSYLAYYPKLSLHYPPLPQVLFSIGYAIFGVSLQVGRIISILLSIGLAVVVYYFANEVFKNKSISRLAAALVMTSSIIINMSILAMQEISFVFFFTLTMFWLYKIRGNDRKSKNFVILGVLMALTVLTKWQAVTILPVVIAYSLLFERKILKHTLLAVVVTAILLAPYYFVLWKTNLLLLPFTANLEADVLDPTFLQVEGWTYYINAILNEQFFLPVGALVLISALAYFLRKKTDWKFFATWFFVVFVIMVVLHNKDARYSINFLPALTIPASFVIYRVSQKLGNMHLLLFLVIGLLLSQTILSYMNIIYGFKDADKVGEYIADGNGNILINTGLGTASPFIFEVARNGDGFNQQVFRPCVIEFLQESPEGLIEKFNIRYIVTDKATQGFTDKQKAFTEFIQNNNNFNLVKNFERFSVTENKNYNPWESEQVCNYICATREFTCTKFKQPSDALK